MAELKALQSHVDERHHAGTEMLSMQKKAEHAESHSKDGATVVRSEADRAEAAFDKKHEESLSELKKWKETAGERYGAFLAQVEAVAHYFFNQ